MSVFYADTSFLASLYIQDAFSARAREWLAKHPIALPLTEFGRAELRNAVGRCVFRGALTPEQYAAAWQIVEIDLSEGRLEAKTMPWPAVFAHAERLSAQHAGQMGIRTLDILHIASAQQLEATDFVSFDSRQAQLVTVVGLQWHLP